MKKDFSAKWKSSTKPRKQRKWRFMAPLHLRGAMLSAHLSKDLRKKHGRRAFPLRKGDEVKVMIGSFKGKTGKILEVNTTKAKAYLENVQRTKKDGKKVFVPIDPSNLMITSLNLDDKKRIKALSKEAKKAEEKKK